MELNFQRAVDALNASSFSYKNKSDAVRTQWVEGAFDVDKLVLLSTGNIQDIDTIGKDVTDEGMVAATRKLMPLYIGPFKIKALKGPTVTIPAKRDSQGVIIREELKRHISVELDLPWVGVSILTTFRNFLTIENTVNPSS